MDKSKEESKYRTIGEVAKILNLFNKDTKTLATHTLRFWEKEFQIINPKKNQSGTRKFSSKDIEKFELIYSLVKERGFTLEGAKKELSREKKGNLSVLKKLQKIRQELLRIKAEL